MTFFLHFLPELEKCKRPFSLFTHKINNFLRNESFLGKNEKKYALNEMKNKRIARRNVLHFLEVKEVVSHFYTVNI